MQTFFVSPNYFKTAKILDYRRLGKQRVEAKQIVQILLGETQSTAYRNHPAVLMWRGYERELSLYGLFMCYEWKGRGYVDNLIPWFRNKMLDLPICPDPWWANSRKLIRSHKSNLLRKDSNYYSVYFKNTPSDLPYFWPVRKIK